MVPGKDLQFAGHVFCNSFVRSPEPVCDLICKMPTDKYPSIPPEKT